MPSKKILVPFLFIGALACGKAVFLDGDDPTLLGNDQQKRDPADPGLNQPPPVPTVPVVVEQPDPVIAGQCPEASRYSQVFMQPDPVVNRSVDLAFVVDASISLDSYRRKILQEVDSFTTALDPGGDYRIAVILGHGGAPYAGRLLKVGNEPTVLDSRVHSPAFIAAALQKKLTNRLPDSDSDSDGEALFYSLDRLLNDLPQVQNQGFFRPDASWSLIFVTDENDICFRPELHGFRQFPDYVPSQGRTEEIAYRRLCLDTVNRERLTPLSLLTRLNTLQPVMPVALGGIIHHDPSQMTARGEQAISHGVLEMLRLHNRSTVIGLGEPSYRAGLQNLANQSTTTLHLATEFPLAEGVALIPDSVVVTVDGTPTAATYLADRSLIRIELGLAGVSRSHIRVSACRR